MNPNNFCIIMAGGTGSRFWPMSSMSKPKQFVDIFGTGRSMLQNTFTRFERLCPRENIIIVTTRGCAEQVRQQIPDLLDYQVLCEPMRRNTAPCIAYAAAVINEINPNANIVVTPSDHAIFDEDLFEKNLHEAIDLADRHDWIVTIGVKPINPTSKYGYIQFVEQPSLSDMPGLHRVVTFVEKPPVEMAVQFIASGEFFWNAGILVWRLPVLREVYRRHLPSIAVPLFGLGLETSASELAQVYSTIDTISVDRGIMEKAENVHVMEAEFGWSDVETWDSIYQACPKDENGNAVATGKVLAYDCKNCVVHIPSAGTIIMEGLENYIVTANDEVLMICHRDCEPQITKYASDYELYKSKKNKI